MVTVTPFKGIRYNPEKIVDIADVTTPPYDVISPTEQDAFYKRHPENVIRLILGRSKKTDSVLDNPHTRSAAYYKDWISAGILKQDEKASLYLKAIPYPHDGETITRYGLIARVGL
jgi:uncharacterized protein (DUF1015 family)